MSLNLNPYFTATKGSHCSYCGSRFSEQIVYPRKCFRCGNDTFANPVPVVVALIAVVSDDQAQLGCLLQKRVKGPHQGGWALPSGFLELGETWQQGVAREIQEELSLITQPIDYQLHDVKMSANLDNLLVITKCVSPVKWSDIPFQPNEEVSEIRLTRQPEELCFANHTNALRQFLGEL